MRHARFTLNKFLKLTLNAFLKILFSILHCKPLVFSIESFLNWVLVDLIALWIKLIVFLWSIELYSKLLNFNMWIRSKLIYFWENLIVRWTIICNLWIALYDLRLKLAYNVIICSLVKNFLFCVYFASKILSKTFQECYKVLLALIIFFSSSIIPSSSFSFISYHRKCVAFFSFHLFSKLSLLHITFVSNIQIL